MPESRARARGLVGLMLLSSLLAFATLRAIVAKVGHPGAPLDDSYIHFQYARAIAEGHPFRFQAGEPGTSGATSLLWPFLLAPFYALGARDERILYPAWGISFLALALLAYEAFLLTRRLAGDTAAAGASLLIFSFSGFLWGAATGMEVLPFAWATAYAVRRAAEWSEEAPHERTVGRAFGVAFAASIAPLFRPEGALVALFAALTLLAFPGTDQKTRLASPLALFGTALVPVVLFLTTGNFRSSTAIVKLLPGNPYYPGPLLFATIRDNAEFLRTSIMDGGQYSVEFLPHGGGAVAFLGLLSIPLCGIVRGAKWRAVGILLLALSIFAPAAYVTFLWNRLRYLWPFATGWLIGVACLARCLADLLARFVPRGRLATGLLCALPAGILAAKQDSVIDDIAQSASGIDRQQVRLGRWAKTELPAGVRIGVNDTGAIAYFGEKKTFDIVGLTTDSEPKYWVAGAASRFEHYERLHATSPEKLPAIFMVYPEWMACSAVLGRKLYEATVTDSNIVGAPTMEVHEADWSLLGSGDRPWTAVSGELVDDVDVADLESEGAHAYALAGARDGEEVARVGVTPNGLRIADGGRTMRTRDSFVAHLPKGGHGHVTWVARLGAELPLRLLVRAGGRPPVIVALDEGPWGEVSLPLGALEGDVAFEVTAEAGRFNSFHYWFVAE